MIEPLRIVGTEIWAFGVLFSTGLVGAEYVESLRNAERLAKAMIAYAENLIEEAKEEFEDRLKEAEYRNEQSQQVNELLQRISQSPTPLPRSGPR